MSLVDVLVRRAKADAVATVMIGGVVYAEGRFTRIDREAILEAVARELDRPDTKAEACLRDLARHLIDPVARSYADWPVEAPNARGRSSD